MIFSYMKLLMR
jgi:hypothetical protein